jgi:hypothetical protein
MKNIKGKDNENIIDESSDSSSEDDDIEQEVVPRKTHYNELRKEVLKSEFDKNKIFTSNELTSEDKIMRDKVDMIDEWKELKNDYKLVNKAMKAVETMSEGKVPKASDYKAYATITDKYEAFFDEKEIGSNKDYEEEKQSVKDLKGYIFEELGANKTRKKEIEEITSLKRKYDDSEASSSSKRTITNDYIDSLPKDYNPFDDIGDDKKSIV